MNTLCCACRFQHSGPPHVSAGMHVPHAIRADEVCPACEQSAGEDSRMVRCKACRNAFHQVCVMHNPLLMPDDDFECGSENCEAPVPFQLPQLYSTSMEPSPSTPHSMWRLVRRLLLL